MNILVTGASKGIGKAIAEELKNIGDVYITGRNEQALKQVKACDYCVCDLTTEFEKLSNFIKQNNIDVLVNNAGIEFAEPFEEKSVDHWKETLGVNLIGTFLVSKYVSKYMLDNRYGKIINVASDSGIDSFSPFSMDYNASKAGIVSLTKDLAIQLQPYINVNCIAPGWVYTDINQKFDPEFLKEQASSVCVQRIAMPNEIAKVVVFLASEDSKYINGEIIKIDGGKQ